VAIRFSKVCNYLYVLVLVVLTISAISLIGPLSVSANTYRGADYQEADAALIFNEAEHKLIISPLNRPPSSFNNAVFRHRTLSMRAVVDLFPALGELEPGISGESLVRRGCDSIVFLSAQSDDGMYGINVGLLTRGAVVWGVDFDPVVSVVHGVDVEAFIVPAGDFSPYFAFLQATFSIDGNQFHVFSFVDLQDDDDSISAITEGMERVTQIVNGVIISKLQ